MMADEEKAPTPPAEEPQQDTPPQEEDGEQITQETADPNPPDEANDEAVEQNETSQSPVGSVKEDPSGSRTPQEDENTGEAPADPRPEEGDNVESNEAQGEPNEAQGEPNVENTEVPPSPLPAGEQASETGRTTNTPQPQPVEEQSKTPEIPVEEGTSAPPPTADAGKGREPSPAGKEEMEKVEEEKPPTPVVEEKSTTPQQTPQSRNSVGSIAQPASNALVCKFFIFSRNIF